MAKLIDTFGCGEILAALRAMPAEKDADVVISAFAYFEPSLVRKLWESGIAVEGARAAGHRYARACADWGRRRLAGAAGMDRLAALADKVIGKLDELPTPSELVTEKTSEDDLGDLLVAIVSAARANGLDAERALRTAVRRVISDAER
jgi:NTP pyrophosphatase (non-canonical NTP hydrolase)